MPDLAQSLAPTGAQPPQRAANFIGALGVNTHLGSPSQTAANIVADMNYLGLANIRDHALAPTSSASHVAAFGAVAAAGIKFDWLTGAAIGGTISALDAFLHAHPGAISAIEGPNEVNNFALNFNGMTGTAAAVAYQSALYSAVKADPLTLATPVLNFTDSPRTAGAADAANAHPYPRGGVEPSKALTVAQQAYAKLMPGKPIYFTETGYPSLPASPNGVDETTQAKLTLNTIMDAARLGARGTYLYDLVDDGADPSGTVLGDHFGLFTLSGQPKPSAVAIHNLTSILADPGATATTFSSTPLNYAIAGLPATGDSLLLEKSNGAYDIVVWAEPQIWDATNHVALAAPSSSVSVAFDAAFAHVAVFDPLASSAPIETVSNASSVTIGLTDHPMIVQVSNFAQAMAGLGGRAAAPTLGAIAPPASAAASMVLHARTGH